MRELYTLKKGPAWGHMQRCFELTVHMNGMAIFGDERQWLNVSSDGKTTGSLSHKGRAAAWFTAKKEIKGEHRMTQNLRASVKMEGQ